MGLNIKELIVKKEIAVKDLHGKTLVVDSHNLLYQFLTTIRAADGSVLTDAKGRVTSHLIGLFNRTTALMEEGIKLAFVFDGKAPEIKAKTWERRTSVKQEAFLKLQEAEKRGDLQEMRKYASRTAILTKEMITDAQALLTALGLPLIQAPSEGEAQTAYIVQRGDAYAAVSQDYDSLIFGCPLLVRNLSIAGKRKKAGTLAYQTVKPELISLTEVLQHLQLQPDQLIVLAILIGTDYNPGGIKGIGPKTALKLLHQYGTNFDALFKHINWAEEYPELPWSEVFTTIKQIPVTKEYTLRWKPLNRQSILQFLVKERGFSEERVLSRIDALMAWQQQYEQKGLKSFLV